MDSSGVVEEKSVLAAIRSGRWNDTEARNLRIASTGENFNGVFVQDADYQPHNPRITLEGNGRSDFVGYGAAIVSRGVDTTLVVDGANIDNQGVVRTGVIADGGSNVIVKNSRISTHDGELPAGYQSTVDLRYMQQAPWMLGIVGNARATNLLGEGTKATYINSSIYAEGWGVLSTDVGENMVLTSINNTLRTGNEGYGSYIIGGATERFLGTRFDVDDYAAINRGGIAYYGDSTREPVAQLNAELGLGLTDREIRRLQERRTTVDSGRWGVMWHGPGGVDISGRTEFDTDKATFLVKNQAAAINVDGSQGAELESDEGIVLQMMDDDDPGPRFENGVLLNTGVYVEPTGDPVRTSYDVTVPHAEDTTATFTNIELDGNFYNAVRGVPAVPGPPPPGPPPPPEGRNLVLNFTGSSIEGVISASETRHAIPVITAAKYKQIGEVTNTVEPVINNSVLVTLNSGSQWTVTGTSYLSSLTVAADSAVTAAGGGAVTMTVDGVATEIVPGTTYTGAIVIQVA